MGKLGIDTGLLIAQLVNFIILITLLYFVLYKPILKMLDKRSQKIKESMDETERLKQRQNQVEEQVRQQLEQARQETQATIAKAKRDRRKAQGRGPLEARKEAERITERARQEIQQERDAAIEELRKEFVDVAILAAEKVVRKELDKKTHSKLIEEVLQESGKVALKGIMLSSMNFIAEGMEVASWADFNNKETPGRFYQYSMGSDWDPLQCDFYGGWEHYSDFPSLHLPCGKINIVKAPTHFSYWSSHLI